MVSDGLLKVHPERSTFYPTAHSGHGFHLPKHGEVFTKELTIVPGASYLFEEPGKLREVARLAIDWFRKYL